jgi:cytochrome P450
MTFKYSGPPVWAAARQLMLMAGDRLTMMTEAAAHGDAVRLPVGHKVLYLFNHPEHARHVLADHSANYHKGIGLTHARRALGDGLLTSEGQLWRKQRKVIAPAFAGKRIARQTAVIAEETRKLLEGLRRREGQGPVDMTAEFTRLTLGVLGRTLLDADLAAFASIGESFTAIQDQAMFELVTLSAVPMWVPLPKQLRFRRARRDLQRIVDLLVAQRTAAGLDGDDVLTRLIDSAAGEEDPRVGRQRLRDELVTLLLAGHETTASTLGWSLYLVDRHPQVRQRLHEEAVAVLGDRLPTHEDLRELTYTGMVIQEAMRLYPPVWLLPRKAIAADTIGGYRVPAGADVLICPYTLHRRPDMWPQPQRFEPERFATGGPAERSRYAYLPFGSGPRVCVGSQLGMAEAVIVLAMISRELQLRTVPGHQVVAEPMLSLRVRGGLPMSVHRLA